MANPPCMNDDGNAAIFIGTNFDTGESVTLCPPCLVSFCATIVEGMTGIPVSAFIDDMQAAAANPEVIEGGPTDDDDNDYGAGVVEVPVETDTEDSDSPADL